MSSYSVSFEVWSNGRLAANRFALLSRELQRLPGKLREVARLWQEARDQYGEEFPGWSYGDGKLPRLVARSLRGGNLAGLVEKVQATTSGFVGKSGGRSWTIGAGGGDLKYVFREVSRLDAFVGDLAERVDRAQREYDRRLALLKMSASLRATSKSHAAASRAAEGSAEGDQAQREERDRGRCAEDASRLLETLAADVSSEDRAAIEERAREAVASPQASRRRALLAQLRLDIQRANEAGRTRRRAVEQAQQWRGRLLGLEGPEVEELEAELRRVVAGQAPMPPDMAQQVEGVVARATEASNRAYALGVITEELQNLGYVAEVGFETASAQAPEMLLRKPDMEEDYHVSLRFDAGAPFLHNRVVREADDPDPDLDSAGGRSEDRRRMDDQAERGWCQDLASALAAAEHKGVRGRAVSRNPPGEEPVPTIAPLKGRSRPERKRKRKRTGRLRSRSGP